MGHTALKIDCHLHLSRKQLPGIGKMKISSATNMLPHLAELGIAHGILMSGAGSLPVGSNEENRRIVEEDPEHYSWMCNPDLEKAAKQGGSFLDDFLAGCREQGACGIGELMYNKRLDTPVFERLFEAAGKLHLPCTFHMSPREGVSYGVVDEPGLVCLEKLLQAFPDTIFMGHSQVFWIEMSGDAPKDDKGRSAWGEGPVVPGGRVPELFAKYPNLHGDLSANSGSRAIMRDPAFGLQFLETYQDRLVFATDMLNVEMEFPLGKWLDEQVTADTLSQAAYDKICRDNAVRLYGIRL